MLTLAAVGRGGQGDVGQRIRDEILYVQSRNNAKVASLMHALWALLRMSKSQPISIALAMSCLFATTSQRREKTPR